MAFQGLHTAISGLNAAQIGLYVTGHNMANNHTMGFTRQIVTQAHFVHRTIGSNAMGPMQVGLGTQMTGIRQVRSHFHDMRWRETAPRLSYWETRAATHMELDSIFGELQGHYRLQLSLTNLNAALNELNNDTSSIETRSNFISQAATFIDRANAAHRSMTEYQMQLNNDVKATVQRVNQILTDIDELNQRIVLERNKGQNPNDFLDWRNNLLDELSTIMDINIIEVVGGSVNILTAHGGNQLLVNGNVSRLGLQYSYPGWPFVEPVFTHEERILAFDEDAPPLFNWDALGRNYILANGGERGHLLSLIVNRGLGPIDHTSAPIETEAEIVARFNTLLDGWITGAGIAAPPDPDGVAAETFRTQFVAMLNAPSFARPDISTITIPAVLNTWAGAQTPPIDVLGEMERFVFDMDLVAKRRFNMNVSVIPRVIAQLDTLVNGMVNMFNDAFTTDVTGNGLPRNQRGQQHDPANGIDMRLFVTIRPPDDNYTLGNLQINPVLMGQGGASFLALTFDGESDNRLTLNLLNHWNSDFISFDGNDALGINAFYRNMITDMANGGRAAVNAVRATTEEMDVVQNRRMSISAVSLEEEMSNMIRFQHAFNAASRVVNTIDSMIDRLVNGLGAGRG